MTIRIVTDSTCDLPESLIRQHGITIVPLSIQIGTETFVDGIDISREAFYRGLPDYPSFPTTSTPSPGQFLQAYRRLVADGASQILSIHIAESLSATANSARLAAQEIEAVPITVYDAGQITAGTGFAVLEAAEAAAAGRSMDEIIHQLQDLAQRSYVFAVGSTLAFLRRSGRVSLIRFALGTILSLKPFLKMHNGISQADPVRTYRRAMATMVQLASEQAPLERLALVHTNDPERAEALRQEILDLTPPDREVFSVQVTPVIGSHVGPGTVGLALVAKEKK
jgi:DegV family protein with EDD domain